MRSSYVIGAAALERQGAKFVMVDMRSPLGPTTQDLYDTRHPNDSGYLKMATVWKQGIDQALKNGWIKAPAENGIPLEG